MYRLGLPPYIWPGYEHLGEKLPDVDMTEVLANDETFVAKIDVGGESLIFRRPNPDTDSFESEDEATAYFEGRITGLYRGLGGAGLEQMVYYDPVNQHVVTECAPGQVVSDLPLHVAVSIGESAFSDLYTVVEGMRERQIVPDMSSAKNLTYDIDQGFTIIDYSGVEKDHPMLGLKTGVLSAAVLWQMVEEWTGDTQGQPMRAVWQRTFDRGMSVLNERFPDALDHFPERFPFKKDWFIKTGGYLKDPEPLTAQPDR